MSECLGKLLITMDKHLKELTGIENKLYYQIIVKK